MTTSDEATADAIRAELEAAFDAPADELLALLNEVVEHRANTHTQALQIAARRGRSELVTHLLNWEESEADPAADDSIALWLAVAAGDLEAARLLVENGRVDAERALASDIGGGRIYSTSAVDLEAQGRTRAVFEFLYESGALAFDHDMVYEYIGGCYGWIEFHLLEALAEAALAMGAWTLSDSEMADNTVPLGEESNDWYAAPPGRAAFMGFAGIVAHFLRDPRTSPHDVETGWHASGRGWRGDRGLNDVYPPIGGRQRVLDVLATDPRCHRLTAKARNCPPNYQDYLLMAMARLPGGRRPFRVPDHLRDFVRGLSDEELAELRA